MSSAEDNRLALQGLRSSAPVPAGEFRLTPIGELLDEPIEERDYLVDGLLTVGGLSLCTGKPFCGKSTLVRNLALCVSRGDKFLGFSTKQVRVGVFALEQRRAEVAEHFRRMGGTSSDLLFIHTGLAPFENACAQLRSVIEENRLGLAIIDPLVLLLLDKLKDGDGYVEVYKALAPLISIARETDCSIVAVQHMGKTEREGMDQTIGSTAYAAAADTMLMMRVKERSHTLETTQRAGSNLRPTVITLDERTGVVSMGVPLTVVKAENMKAAVIEYLRRKGDMWVGSKQLQAEVGVKRSGLFLILNSGVADGTIERDGKGSRNDEYKFRIKQGTVVELDAQRKRRFQK